MHTIVSFALSTHAICKINMFWRKKAQEIDGNPCFEKQYGQNTIVDVDLDFANNKMLRFT